LIVVPLPAAEAGLSSACERDCGNRQPLSQKRQIDWLRVTHKFDADKVQQSVLFIGVYNQFYVVKCMSTMDATMQVYPSGLQWLKQAQQARNP
jgi:hypothetical protein